MDSEDKLFRDIYTAYMPWLRVIAGNKKIPLDEVDDLIQDTFTAYYSHYPLDWPSYRIKATLTKIMKNRCVDYYRKQGRNPVTYYDPLVMQETDLFGSKTYGRDSLSICLEQQEYQEVMNIILGMKEDWVSVVLLYLVEGRPMSEVGRILGVSAEACRARLCRARKYLKKRYNPDWEEKGNSKGNGDPSPEDGLTDPKDLPDGT